MTEPTAIKAHITGCRTVKSRAVYQVELEIPQENFRDFNNAFDVPGVVTLLNVGPDAVTIKEQAVKSSELKQQLKDSVAHEKRKWNELSRAQQAGIACNEVLFRTFLNEQHAYNCEQVDDAAAAVREICGILSRSELDKRDTAAKRWDNLYREYQTWQRVDA